MERKKQKNKAELAEINVNLLEMFKDPKAKYHIGEIAHACGCSYNYAMLKFKTAGYEPRNKREIPQNIVTYVPTEEEIARHRDAIKLTWTEDERQSRAKYIDDSVQIKVVKTPPCFQGNGWIDLGDTMATDDDESDD